jgi:hypothetical protein
MIGGHKHDRHQHTSDLQKMTHVFEDISHTLEGNVDLRWLTTDQVNQGRIKEPVGAERLKRNLWSIRWAELLWAAFIHRSLGILVVHVYQGQTLSVRGGPGEAVRELDASVLDLHFCHLPPVLSGPIAIVRNPDCYFSHAGILPTTNRAGFSFTTHPHHHEAPTPMTLVVIQVGTLPADPDTPTDQHRLCYLMLTEPRRLQHRLLD